MFTYNIFFHPLRKYPGPKLWAASRLPYSLMIKSGFSHRRVLELHQQYGDVVRVAPNELAFSNPDAWKEIMGHRRKGQGENGKDTVIWELVPHSIIAADREDHSKYRRLLAHGFSNQAMMDQQPMIRHYVNLLIERLREACKNGTEPLNMVSWYNFTTFDIIGNLVFGESFGCLDNSSYHPWVSFLFDTVRLNTLLAEFRRWSIGRFCLRWLTPKAAMEKVLRHKTLTEEKADQRLRLEESRPDFMEAMSQAKRDSVSAHLCLEY